MSIPAIITLYLSSVALGWVGVRSILQIDEDKGCSLSSPANKQYSMMYAVIPFIPFINLIVFIFGSFFMIKSRATPKAVYKFYKISERRD